MDSHTEPIEGSAPRGPSEAKEAPLPVPVKGNWADMIPLVLLLVFLWSLLLLGIGYLTVQSLHGQLDLGVAAVLEDLWVVILVAIATVGTTLYVRAKWKQSSKP